MLLAASLNGLHAPESNASDSPPEPDCITVSFSEDDPATRTVVDGYSCSGSVVIPNGVTSIGNYAFQGAAGLTSISIPNSVKSIGTSAFRNASSLNTVTFEDGSLLETIGQEAFLGNLALTRIVIPKTVNSIGAYAFLGADSLLSVSFEEDSELLEIPYQAFKQATLLNDLKLPQNLQFIKAAAFENAISLSSILIPASVIEIEEYAFYGATSLRNVRFLGSPPVIRTGAFSALVDPDAKALVNRSQFESFTAATIDQSPNWSELTVEVFTFPSGDTTCLVKTTSIIVNGVDCVGPITISNTMTSLQDNSFFSAESLTSITLPSTLTSIGARAFESATSLSLIRLMGAAPSVGVDAFLNVAIDTIARIDQVHQSSYVLVDGLWNGLVLDVIIPPVSNTITSVNTALDREIERLREAEKKLARANLVTLARGSAPLTLDLFNQASISGVTAKNFAGVAAEITELPIDRRSQIDEILKIARKFEVVDKVASSDRIYSSMLQEVGLISQDSNHKAALTAVLRKLPSSERSSYLAIKQAIDAQMAEIQTRKTRLSEVVAQIAARRKG